ncbi:hypothetical protein G7054_g12571 [Neopestalotiopsis clavispora]|nr:hypothetical protein G7054_g12571 [Neopestalotiopsis clavispora]
MASDTTATSPVSRFPVYLLPSFNVPFRRRRQSSVSTTNYGSPPSETHVPSLGSSPTDSSLSSSLESPPTTPSSYFPSRFSFSKIGGGRWATPAVVNSLPHVTTRLTQTQPNTIRCSHCSADLAFTSQIVSKGFTGRYGRAYLVSPPENTTGSKGTADLVNILIGKSESRVLVTGSHVVADISCAVCRTKVGWKYVDAKEETQKYKVGKFILETARVADYQSWEDVTPDEMPAPAEIARKQPANADDEPIVFDSDDEDECEDIFSGTWDPEVVAKRRSKKVNRRPRQIY